jgi:serine/threonine protein kinase/uncharacterized protein with WD repeat
MSDATPSRPSTDRNLLFGILALQMDFISRDALIAAMNAWVLDKAKPLGELLLHQQMLRPDQRAALDVLVGMHLECHDNDAEKSLAAIAIPQPVRDQLHSLVDGDVEASLARIAGMPTPSRGEISWLTRVTVADQPNIAGLRYHILRPHGKGGIGEVFVALDQELNRQVALKEIQDQHADDPQSRGRFVREAEITGGLEHPGIVPVYGLGQYGDGRPYYAMRFIQGETLKDAIACYHQASDGVHLRRSNGMDEPRRSPEFELRALLTRFVAVCNTIAYAHSRGVIHRDIKPSNIMLGKFGEKLIVDWGLAKAIGHEPAPSVGDGSIEPPLIPRSTDGIAETHMGAALGTPAYMSPEQAAGRLDKLGPASDIYSLGATLYTLLTGAPPVDSRKVAEALTRVQKGDWLPPRQIKRGVSPALEAICLKSMEMDPNARYATAKALADDVEEWLADEPVAAWPEPWTVRLRRWGRARRSLVTSTLAATLVALVGLTAALLLLAANAEARAKARREAEEMEREAEELRRFLYISQMNVVQREYEANTANIGLIRELLQAQATTSPDKEDLRGFEWHYWDRLTAQTSEALRDGLTLEGHNGLVASVTFSRDGHRVASGSADTTVKVWDAASGHETLTLRGHANEVTAVAFSPDGQHIASSSMDNTVKIWDIALGAERLTYRGHRSWVRSVAFSPDGRRIVSGGHDNKVKVWNAFSGDEIVSLEGHTNVVTSVAFSPDGQSIISGGSDGTVRVWDVARGRERHILKGPSVVTSVAFSPNSRWIAGGGHKLVQLWDADNGQETVTLKGHSSLVTGVTFSPDGRRIASASQDHGIKVWEATKGLEVLRLKGATPGFTSVVFSPDGKRIASGSTAK